MTQVDPELFDRGQFQAELALKASPIAAFKKAIRQARQNQIAGAGFSLVELLSSCPTNWGMTPVEALHWIETEMVPAYPLGDFKTCRL